MTRCLAAFALPGRLLLVLAVLLFVPGHARADERWLVVSDMHLNPFDGSSESSPPGDDTNPMLLRSSLVEMRAVVANPSMVLIAGDFLAHHFPERSRAAHGAGMAERDALAAMTTIAHGLGGAFPRAHFAIALGNNDDPCGDYRSEVDGPYLTALARLWAPLVNRDGAAPSFATSFARGGYGIASALHGRLRLVMLNDIYWSFFYRGACTRTPYDPAAAERVWMERAVSTMPRTARAALLMHVPPGIDATSTIATGRLYGVPFLRAVDDRALTDLFATSHDRIAWALAGHTHRNDMRSFGNVPMLLVSAISPVYKNEPEFYVLDVRDDGSIGDVETYALSDDGWMREPSFDRSWNVPSFSNAAVLTVHDRLERDPALRDRWAVRYTGWAWRVDDINAATWRVYWCAQTTTRNAFSQCAGTGRRLSLVVMLVAALILVVVTAVIMILASRRGSSRKP